MTPEIIASKWAQVGDFSTGSTYPESSAEMMEMVMSNMEADREAAEAAATAEPAAPVNKSGLGSESIFNLMGMFLSKGEGASAIKTCKAVYGFNILLKKGGKPALQVTIDLKNGNGSVLLSAPEKPDATFTMTDSDFKDLCMGKLKP